jgi:hypothetical protein
MSQTDAHHVGPLPHESTTTTERGSGRLSVKGVLREIDPPAVADDEVVQPPGRGPVTADKDAPQRP